MTLATEALKAKAWFAGLNWQLLAAKLLAFALWSAGMFFWGILHEQKSQLEERAKQAEHVVEVVKDRLPVMAESERRAAEQASRLEKIGEKYDQAVDAAGDKPECSLSADELRNLQELAE